jgi:ABC-type multidrug transport system ATPase subunit
MVNQAQRSCGELAYGDLKRLELAIALANDPKLLLMDEPAAGMAPRERHALMGLTGRIARERTIGVLFTEHDMDVVFGHADRVLVLNRGSLIAEGAPAAVRAKARVQEVYLGGFALGAVGRGRRFGRAARRRLRSSPGGSDVSLEIGAGEDRATATARASRRHGAILGLIACRAGEDRLRR